MLNNISKIYVIITQRKLNNLNNYACLRQEFIFRLGFRKITLLHNIFPHFFYYCKVYNSILINKKKSFKYEDV